MKEEIFNQINHYETIIIHRHVRPDPDAYGSQGGLAELIRASYPDKNVYVVGEEEESLMFLNRMDHINDDTYKGSLVIVCDTANQERISDDRYLNGDVLIKIDHHPNNEPYGDIVWVDTDASSVSEMIFEFYLFGKDKGLKLTPEAAKLIYAGIVGDTGRFMYANTRRVTFQYAGELIDTGIDIQTIYNQLYEKKANVAKLSGYVISNFKLTGNGVAYMQLDKELLESYEVTANESSQFVGSLANIKGVRVWVFFVEEENQIRVRLRSKGPIINTVAQKYNGGGHPLASGATIYSWDEMSNVLADLDEVCQ